MNRAVIITGADEAFADFLLDAVQSLTDVGVNSRVDIGVLDQGLSPVTLASLSRMGCKVVAAEWPDFVPPGLRTPHQIGLASRLILREIFPGYEKYLWFDADAWAQSHDFLDMYLSGATRCGAAVASENGAGYRTGVREKKWWFGNYISVQGVRNGLPLALKEAVNIGVLCLASAAPHWKAWSTEYQLAIERTGKLNLDQHAFHAAIHKGHFGTQMLPAVANWQPILSVPRFDERRGIFVAPGPTGTPISVMHLAGPNKSRLYPVDGVREGVTSLVYRTVRPRLGY